EATAQDVDLGRMQLIEPQAILCPQGRAREGGRPRIAQQASIRIEVVDPGEIVAQRLRQFPGIFGPERADAPGEFLVPARRSPGELVPAGPGMRVDEPAGAVLALQVTNQGE